LQKKKSNVPAQKEGPWATALLALPRDRPPHGACPKQPARDLVLAGAPGRPGAAPGLTPEADDDSYPTGATNCRIERLGNRKIGEGC